MVGWNGLRVANRGNARLQSQKVEIAAPVQGERNDLTVLDDIAYCSAAGLHFHLGPVTFTVWTTAPTCSLKSTL